MPSCDAPPPGLFRYRPSRQCSIGRSRGGDRNATGRPSSRYLRACCACSTHRATMPAQPRPDPARGGIRYNPARCSIALVRFQGHIAVCRAHCGPSIRQVSAASDAVASESNAVMGTHRRSGGHRINIGRGSARRWTALRCGACQGRRSLPAHRALHLSIWRVADRCVIDGTVH